MSSQMGASRLTIVDSHVHLKHGDVRRTEYTADEIIQVMDGAGIAQSVVFAMSTTTQRSIQMASDAVQSHPDRLIPYVYALPSYERPVLDEIDEALSERCFRGIKLHMGECTVADYVAGPLFELAAAYGVPCLIDFSGRLSACEAAIAAHPRTLFIICHLGQYLSTNESLIDGFIDVATKHSNVYLDASGVALLHKVAEAAIRVGADRILFGTDGPHSVKDGPLYTEPDTVTYARSAIDGILSLDLTQAEQEAILGGNIRTLLGIPS
jgi:predicted TIM-barrel fold metal-dependent hydrolase